VDENQVERVGVERGGQGRAGVVEQREQLVLEEAHRLALQAALPFLVRGEDGARRRAEGAVVEKDDVRVELKVCA
jgi:hypothetical protein